MWVQKLHMHMPLTELPPLLTEDSDRLPSSCFPVQETLNTNKYRT